MGEEEEEDSEEEEEEVAASAAAAINTFGASGSAEPKSFDSTSTVLLPAGGQSCPSETSSPAIASIVTVS